jgi:hypothetical protein
MKGYDAYNKKNFNEDSRDMMFDWANKVFGRSGEFEDMLMGTYKDPSQYYTGPEGQALANVTENRLMKQDFQRGRGTNSFPREVEFRDRMLLGLNNHRSGLVNSANIGRSQSGDVMRGIGQGLDFGRDASQWYTPLTWGANDPNKGIGGTVKDLWDTGTSIWDTAKGVWDWATGD